MKRPTRGELVYLAAYMRCLCSRLPETEQPCIPCKARHEATAGLRSKARKARDQGKLDVAEWHERRATSVEETFRRIDGR